MDFRNSTTERPRERWPWAKGEDGSGNTNSSAATKGTITVTTSSFQFVDILESLLYDNWGVTLAEFDFVGAQLCCVRRICLSIIVLYFYSPKGGHKTSSDGCETCALLRIKRFFIWDQPRPAVYCSNNEMKAQIKPCLLPGEAAEEQCIYRSDKCFFLFEWH